jgi:uncharacterized protein YbjT (DUF2867 family)
MLGMLHRGPLLAVPRGWRMQPVAVGDVAGHLADRVTAAPAGGIEEMAGPETGTLAEFARTMLEVRGETGRVLEVPVPGRLSRAVRAGAGLVGPAATRGSLAWRDWLSLPEAATETAAYTSRVTRRR